MSATVITKPELIISEDVLAELKQQFKEESQVIVHCLYASELDYESYIRIWPSTYLFDDQSAHQSKLVHVEKITLFPNWLRVPSGANHNFSLIFSGLPSQCQSFDLKEIIPQAGGFEVIGIARNETDVYFVNI